MNPGELQKLPLFAGFKHRDLMDYARRLELDKASFGEALKTHKYFDRVRADVSTGRQHGVTGNADVFCQRPSAGWQ